jgi:UDPglucose 6-dehydrogenase
MKVAIAGAGYVGLVSGVCLASKGHQVVCLDVNRDIVCQLNEGKPHIHECGLGLLLNEARAARCFRATAHIADALDGAEMLIVAVGTPSVDGVIDLRYVQAIARDVGAHLANGRRTLSVVVKSTVVPGTTDTLVREEIEKAGITRDRFGLGMNPEFLREGEAIADFMEPDRIVLGHEDERTLALLEELYAPWDCDKVRVNTRTAELIKYANNALLATQISAVNEIANLAAALGSIDVAEVVQSVHLDRRWSPVNGPTRVRPGILAYLVPGCGFGGSCFPKDVQALRSQGEQLGLQMRMLNAVLDVNEAQPGQVAEILERELGDLRERRCLLLGLAFKPETDDVRESASLKIVHSLLDRGVEVVAHDPIAAGNFRAALGSRAGQTKFVRDWQDSVADAPIVIIATKWDEYRQLPSFDLRGKTVFDARRMFDPDDLPGARYCAIGRRIPERCATIPLR